MEEGNFVEERPSHFHYLEFPFSEITSQLLKVMQPIELRQLKLNQEIRKQLMLAYVNYYSLHISGFGVLKSLPILQEIF